MTAPQDLMCLTGYCPFGSLAETATIPIPSQTATFSAAQGNGLINPDGRLIKGGRLVNCGGAGQGYGAGEGGVLSLTGLGFPGGQCAYFPLYAGSNKQYTTVGWNVMTNPNALANYPVL